MVQIIMVEITVIIKYLKGNLTGIGLNVDFVKDLIALKAVTYHATRFKALSVVIIKWL